MRNLTNLFFIPAAAITFVPVAASAATFADIVNKQLIPFGDSIVRLFYALAFIFFLIGLARLFLSNSEESRQKGRMYAIWGIVGLCVLFATWGLVHILLSVLSDFAA